MLLFLRFTNEVSPKCHFYAAKIFLLCFSFIFSTVLLVCVSISLSLYLTFSRLLSICIDLIHAHTYFDTFDWPQFLLRYGVRSHRLCDCTRFCGGIIVILIWNEWKWINVWMPWKKILWIESENKKPPKNQKWNELSTYKDTYRERERGRAKGRDSKIVWIQSDLKWHPRGRPREESREEKIK